MSTIQLSNQLDASALHDSPLLIQNQCGDKRTCSRRRYERMPAELRLLYRQLSEECDPACAWNLRRQAWELRKQRVDRARTQSLLHQLSTGCVFTTSKKLHRVARVFPQLGFA